MTILLYSVFDKVALSYSHPEAYINDRFAKREVKNIMKNPEHRFSLNPQDYTLYRLGLFDDGTGDVELHKTLICNLGCLNSADAHNTILPTPAINEER